MNDGTDGPRAPGWPRAIQIALALPVLGGLWLTAGVETLSALGLLGSRAAWGAGWALTAVTGLFGIPRLFRAPDAGVSHGLTRPPAWAVALVGTILALTLFVALVSPPNNLDSMAYHNARVMEWWDHGNLTYWTTSIDRQLRMPPLASYFKLALYGLTGNDVLFNIVQWAFFLLSILAAYGLADLISPGTLAGSLAAVLVSTLPMAILQASTTQNDLVLAGYWLTGAFFFLSGARGPAGAHRTGLLLGCAAVGLSWLAKGTGPLFTGPMLPVALWSTFRIASVDAPGARRAWRRSAMLGVALAVLVNAGHWSRNLRWFGSATAGGPEVVKPTTYLDAGPAAALKLVASQLVRNSALQFDSLRFVGLSSNQLIAVVEELHRRAGLRVDEPALQFMLVPFRSIRQQYLNNESTAGCTWHFLLACGVSLLVCVRSRLHSEPLIAGALALGWLGWLALSVTVRWMPWNQRLQLPVLMWLMVPVACVLTLTVRRWILAGGGAFLLVAALPYLLISAKRPLVSWGSLPARLRETIAPGQPFDTTSMLTTSRWQNYFRGQPSLRQPTENVLLGLPASCEKPSVVGLKIGEESWEYILWVGASRFGRHLRFRHVPEGPRREEVCAVIRSDCPGGEAFCLEITAPP